MRYIRIISIGLVLFSCTSRAKNPIDLDEIMPTIEDDKAADTIRDSGLDSTRILIDNLKTSGFRPDSVQWITNTLFPDRFRPTNSTKFQCTEQGQQIRFYLWNYDDSAKVKSAFFNWIDCFGDGCNSIFVGQEENLQKNAFHLWMNDTSLIFVEAEKSISKTWESYLESKGYESRWNLKLEQGRYGRVKWYRYIDDEKEPIKLELP